MAFYGQYGTKRIDTADISHFRQPYKDYTSLSGFDNTKVVLQKIDQLWWVNDPTVAASLASMIASPMDATADQALYSDPTLVEMALTDSTGGQLPDPSAQKVIQQYVTAGYAAVLVFNVGKPAYVMFTKSSKVLALLASGVQGYYGIILSDPNIALDANRIATAAALPVSTTNAGIFGSSSVGPLGTAILVLGAVGLGYYLFKGKKRRI